jgi:hypothetical protein
MKTFEMDCFEVRESDGDGRGDHHVCYCATRTLATVIAAKNKGWRQVTDYRKAITIFESEEEFEANTTKALRKSALAKLTILERMALGL